MKTIDKVKQIIAEQLCISTDEIKDDANIIEDLGADSLDVVEMLMTLEDEFSIKIPDDQVDKIRTVNFLQKPTLSTSALLCKQTTTILF